jgi:hypothetical protein
MLKPTMQPLRVARELWQSSAARSAIRRRWKRTWKTKAAWPWLKREIEIVAKVSGVVVVSLWLKRLIEQFLGKKVLNEPVLRGEINNIVRGVEDDVQQGRSGHVRTRE